MRNAISIILFGGTILLIGAAAPGAVDGEAVMIVNQPRDARSGLSSYAQYDKVDTHAADDFVLEENARVDTAVVWFLVRHIGVPRDYVLRFYEPNEDYPNEPWSYAFHSIDSATAVIDRGPSGILDYRLFEVRFEEIDLVLEPGRYWLSPVGLWTMDWPVFWATGADEDAVSELDAWWGDWKGLPWSPAEIYLGYPTDLAMRVEGTDACATEEGTPVPLKKGTPVPLKKGTPVPLVLGWGDCSVAGAGDGGRPCGRRGGTERLRSLRFGEGATRRGASGGGARARPRSSVPTPSSLRALGVSAVNPSPPSWPSVALRGESSWGQAGGEG